MAATPGNSINESGASGLMNFDGTATTSTTALAQYNVVTGATNKTVNNIAPSATSGVALISQGSSSQPTYGTVAIAGGGTNATSFTQSNGIVTYNGTSLVNYAGPQINSSGILTNTSQPCFYAYLNTSVTNFTGDGTTSTFVFDTILNQQGTGYSASTGIFTAPVAGYYLVNCTISWNSLLAGHTRTQMNIETSTGISTQIESNPYTCSSGPGNTYTIHGSLICYLGVGGTLYTQGFVSGSTKTVTLLGNYFGFYSYFSMCKLC